MSRPGIDWWQLVSPYLDQALALPESERTSFVAGLRQKDAELAAALQSLLDERHALTEEKFLEQGPELPGQHPLVGQTVGAYTLLAPIGEGGMATVWLGERSDGHFQRRVAIKFLNAAVVGHAGAERFQREGRILGRLSHPHIAELIDAGVSSTGQPFLVLEYVEGQHIDGYCDSRSLPVAERIRLFLDVLAAVAHAHANLIVHRDIKPSNVLVRNDGEVKLLDFGIAKLLESQGQTGTATLLTREGGGALTPQCAAPEQLTAAPITTATDVYALGVLLYVLLTGTHPAGAAFSSSAELVKAIVETEAPRLSQAAYSGADQADIDARAARRGATAEKLQHLLRGDLDTIAGKALKKDPQERYLSVTAFADDLRRYLAHEPISARPDTLGYRAGKFVRRNRLPVALAALALIAIIAGLVGTLLQARSARAQRDFALRQLSRAEAINDLNTFVLSDAAPSGKPFTVNDLLVRAEHIVERQNAESASTRAELLIAIGRQYTVQDDYSKAQRLLEQANQLAWGLPDASLRARAACGLAQILANTNAMDRAEALFQQGLAQLPQGQQFTLDRYSCWLRGSEIAHRRGAAQDAVSRAQAAQAVLRQSPFDSDSSQFDALVDLASAYSGSGRQREAIATFEQAAAKLTALGRDDTQRAATLFNNWGIALWLAGRSLEAVNVLHRAVSISEDKQSETSVAPMLLINYARALQDLGELQQAADYADRGYNTAQRTGASVVVSQALILRSSIYRNRGDLARAQQMLDEVEPWLKRNLPPGHVAFASLTSQRALLAQARGDLKTALRLSDEAIAMTEGSATKGGAAADYRRVFYLRRADVELALSQPDAAGADASRCVTLMQQSAEPGTFSNTLGHAYLTLGRALQLQGKGGEAHNAFVSAANQLSNSLGPDHPDTRAARQLARL